MAMKRILTLLLLLPTLAVSAEILRTNVPSGSTGIQVLPATRRAWVILHCPSTNQVNVYVSLDGSTNVTTDTGTYPGVPIVPGGMLVWSGQEEATTANDAEIWAVHGSTTNQALFIMSR